MPHTAFHCAYSKPPLYCGTKRTWRGHSADIARNRRLADPTFASHRSRFHCKTQHFARQLTFGHILSDFAFPTHHHIKPTVTRRLALYSCIPQSHGATTRNPWPPWDHRYKASSNLQLHSPLVLHTLLSTAPTLNHRYIAEPNERGADIARNRRLADPTFASHRSRFHCKTQHFARQLTFGHILSDFAFPTHHHIKPTVTRRLALYSCIPQ